LPWRTCSSSTCSSCGSCSCCSCSRCSSCCSCSPCRLWSSWSPWCPRCDLRSRHHCRLCRTHWSSCSWPCSRPWRTCGRCSTSSCCSSGSSSLRRPRGRSSSPCRLWCSWCRSWLSCVCMQD
ncbi:hypothetical protein C0J52_20523, partial [Blattella germanica]